METIVVRSFKSNSPFNVTATKTDPIRAQYPASNLNQTQFREVRTGLQMDH